MNGYDACVAMHTALRKACDSVAIGGAAAALGEAWYAEKKRRRFAELRIPDGAEGAMQALRSLFKLFSVQDYAGMAAYLD